MNAAFGQVCLMVDALARKAKVEFVGYRLLPMGSFSKIQKLVPAPANGASSSSSSSSRSSRRVVLSDTASMRRGSTASTDPAGQQWVVYATYDLHGGPGEFTTLNRLLLNSKFEQGLEALLACVKQLAEYCAIMDPVEFNMPYPIDKDKVGGYSIRPRTSSDAWVRACKCLTSDLRWIMAFVTLVAARAEAGDAARSGKGASAAAVTPGVGRKV
ncbi:hypothetical protein AMAG_17086 [Allomyces macrogynus ATCC 38327]|uniref:Atg6 BARA domain-containing protein n=1 Tax=Allomyces macrogynus (strain ATCC 38327) TaxID=578462 RepID=A0A0L0TCW0_ALLM3|nr:hypothetical protein AMAG_17086 [Allomyces macrogynus ATCC 38327]|eukprot:KNE72758.1 hypothetical protein AMAG_17086 [Allomyces macrogynus ATCC 38327]